MLYLTFFTYCCWSTTNKKRQIYTIYKMYKIYEIYKIYERYEIYKIYKMYKKYKMYNIYEIYKRYKMYKIYIIYKIYEKNIKKYKINEMYSNQYGFHNRAKRWQWARDLSPWYRKHQGACFISLISLKIKQHLIPTSLSFNIFDPQ